MELTSEQRNKALWWTGTLTEASVILGMPWRRAWAYVSGSPITIRPILKSAEAKKVKARLPKGARGLIRKGGYCFLELLKLKLADILLSAGLSGKTVQGLLDGGITESVGSLRDHEKLSATILIIIDGINPPWVRAFPASDSEEFLNALCVAGDIGACHAMVNLGSIHREVLCRVVCHQEHREYVAKSPGERVKEALNAALREKELAKAGE